MFVTKFVLYLKATEKLKGFKQGKKATLKLTLAKKQRINQKETPMECRKSRMAAVTGVWIRGRIVLRSRTVIHGLERKDWPEKD